MRLLLTSAGIKNSSIQDALVDLLGRPIAESNALFVPTAMYGLPGGAAMAWRSICGLATAPFCELGWKSMGVLELTALPSIKEGVIYWLANRTGGLLAFRACKFVIEKFLNTCGAIEPRTL
jgi:hypothetical protein